MNFTKGTPLFFGCDFILCKETSDRGQPRIDLEWIYVVWSNHFLMLTQCPPASLNTREQNTVATCCFGTTVGYQVINVSIPYFISCLEATLKSKASMNKMPTKVQ